MRQHRMRGACEGSPRHAAARLASKCCECASRHDCYIAIQLYHYIYIMYISLYHYPVILLTIDSAISLYIYHIYHYIIIQLYS